MKKLKNKSSIRVGKACGEDWNKMAGNENVRFCEHCAKYVNEISSMTRKEAVKLIRRSGGNLCVRYYHHPTSKGPLFAENLIQISRRVPTVATGIITASFGLTSMTLAQGSLVQTPRAAATATAEKRNTDVVVKDDAKASVRASIKGTVLDPNGAVIPGSEIVLKDVNGGTIRRTVSSGEGGYSFEDIEPGKYSVEASASGFIRKVVQNIEANEGQWSVIDLSLDIDGRIVTMGIVGFAEPEYESELARAVSRGDVNAARDLIGRGATVNAKEEEGVTPLHIAVMKGQIEMVRMLIDFGAKPNARDDDRQTPLMMLDKDASRDLVELLVRSGAKVNVSDDEGNSPLILAAEDSTAEVVQALVDAGAEVNAQNEEGFSALMNAAGDEDIEKVRALLLAGADVNLKNKEGDTAWDRTTDEEIENLLVTYGAIVEPDRDEIDPTRD